MDEPMQDDQEERYEGEDTRLTSRKELAGWYSYGWAAEVFAICAMGTLVCNHRSMACALISIT